MHASANVVIGGQRILLRADSSMRPGREGAVYPDPTDPDYVVKVMHAADDEWRKKISVMLKNRLSAPDIAWPVRKVFSVKGKVVVGVRLPFAARKWPLACVYSSDPATRWIQADYAFRVRVAENLAAAMEKVHRHGCVVGDVSPSNILVGKDASVCLIDVDSFQITRDSTYRCCMGSEEYTPAELHGLEFASVDRTVQHDAFGLAELIFQSLVGPGNHPFAASYQGTGSQLGLVQRIQQGIWAYAGTHPDYLPRIAAPFELLHPLLQPLMRRCFVDGHLKPQLRPLPADWLTALAEVRQDLDFLQNTAPQLENEAQAKYASAVAAGLRRNPGYPQARPFAVRPTKRSFCQYFIQRCATVRSPSPITSRIAARLPAIAASALTVGAAALGIFLWSGGSGITTRKLGDKPLPTPSHYRAVANDGTSSPEARHRLPDPDFYEQIANQYRFVPKEQSK